jgi:hypothetical protein
MATSGQPLSTDDKIFGTIMMGAVGIGLIVAVYQGVKYIGGVTGLAAEKSAEMVELDGVELPALPYADTAMTNAMERPVTNVMLNHLYGGVPDPSPSGLIDYITGTPSYLQGGN